MQRQLLNLALLRGDTSGDAGLAPVDANGSGAGGPAQVAHENGDGATRGTISRRRLIGIGGVAAFGLTPLVRAIGATIDSEFEVVAGKRRVSFLVGGRERWTIDASRFAGSPRLAFKRDDARIEIALTGARYPGLEVSADFRCTISRDIRGWEIVMDLDAARFKARGRFEPWLLGAAPLRARASLDTPVCVLADGTRVDARGIASAELHPNWQMRFDGNGFAFVSGLGDRLVSGSLAIGLLSSEAGSILSSAPPLRSLVEIERGDTLWSATIPDHATAGWRLSADDNVFDQISIEAGETKGGSRVHALAAEGTSGEARLRVRPCAGFVAGDGRDTGLPLAHTRYAAAYDGAHRQTAIVARHASETVWLHGSECSLLLGGAEASPRFEIVTRDGRLESYRLEPALVATYIAVEGAIAEPGAVKRGTRASFSREDVATRAAVTGDDMRDGRATAPRDATDVRIDVLDPDDPPIRMYIPRPTIPVIRHEDLLNIAFEFVGMTPSGGTGGRVMTATSGTPYMIAHFPPQNIAEQAFFETDQDYQPEDFNKDKPADTDKNTGNENPLVPTPRMPVKSRIAGLSRLAFKVPPGASIPLEIEALLKAMSEYEPSLAPTALPPSQAVAELHNLIDINSLKIAPAWSGYGKKEAIQNMSKERLSPLVQTANSADFTARPKDLSRARVESKTPVTIRSGGGVRGRAGIVARRSDISPMTAQSLATARTAAGGLSRGKEDIEAIYQIDASDLELAPIEKIDKLKAAAKVRPKLVEPTSTQTAIESPFRLIISPNTYGRWVHALEPVVHAQPVTNQDHTELWHTRLGVEGTDGVNEWEGVDEIDEESTDMRTIRAIWMDSPVPFSTGYTQNPPHYAVGVVNEQNPFRMSLDEFDRHNIVHLSANWHISLPATGGRKTRGWYEPLPIKVERLMLSSLGSWMNVRGAWSPPVPLSVEEWRHRATMGRDHYVRVVYKGYLFPFGHRASLIKITERKFHTSAWGNIAYLRQRMYIVVREPEKTFRTSKLVVKGPNNVIKDDGSKQGELVDLKMPFHKVRITTLITPNLDEPTMNQIAGKGQSGFWPMVGGTPFMFQMSAFDLDNQKTEYAMPVVFVENNIAHDAGHMRDVRNAYDGMSARATTSTHGQKIAFAESDKLGDTSYETETVTFSAAVPNAGVNLPPDQPQFYPVMLKSQLSIPSIKYLANNNSGTEFKYNSDFLKVGFEAANKGKILLDLFSASSPVALSFDDKGDKSGGLVKPNMNISGLSRAMGPVAGPATNIVNGEFKPEEFFAGMGAKIFGVIDLWDILQALGLDKAPQFVTEALTSLQTIQNDLNALKAFLEDPVVGSFGSTVKTDITNVLNALANIITDPGGFSTALTTFSNDVKALKNTLPTVSFDKGIKRSIERLLVDFSRELEDVAKITQYVTRLIEALEIPKEIKVTLEWAPEIKSWPTSKPIFVADGSSKLRLGAEMIAQTNFKSEPKFEIYCRLENFKIDLIGPIASFIILHFNRIEFFANSAMKADVNCDFDRIEFVGVLSFIETLKELIPLDGFSDPPALDVSLQGIDASFSIALPNVAFGVFALSNMTLGAGFTIPFIGEPLSFRFNFCTRENPFTLQISFIGGGGFFGITINPKGVHILEAAFEVGVTLSVDFGVASGSVYAMAGVYFKMEGDDCSLTGYFRLGGEVEVLGIISVSIELYLSLTYEFATGKLVGRATLTISIEVLFFEATVEISAEKKFAGSNGDPTFAQMMAPYSAPSLASPGQMVTVEPWKEYVTAFAW